MSNDGEPAGSSSRPPWVAALVALCVVVGIGVVVAVAGLFMASPVPQPPAPPLPARASGTPSSVMAVQSAYGLGDALPFTAPPVWHASPSAEYRLTAAPDELRYVADSGCSLSFRVRPLQAPTALASGSPRATPGDSSAGASPSASPTADPETAATRSALATAIEAVRSSSAAAAVTDDGAVVTTMDSLTGPLVDMAGAGLRVTGRDGTTVYERLGVRAVPSAQSVVSVAAVCPTPEGAATAINHASVHSYLAAH